MSPRDPDLPDFDNPPVVEVALSVQFKPLPQLRCAHFGVLWQELFKDRFPRTEEWPPLHTAVERFDSPPPPGLGLKIETVPPMPRCWFLNEEGSELLQIQRDRLVHNWRRVKGNEPYPHYDGHIRETFREELVRFRDFLKAHEIGEMEPTQCEVTYVNHIEAGEGWERFAQLGNVITLWTEHYSDAFLSEPEDIRLAARYLIPDDDGNPIGRLHISIEPCYRTVDRKPMLDMKLTARGRPDGPGTEGILAFVDKGRKWIVRGFASVTTVQMHEVWRRKA